MINIQEHFMHNTVLLLEHQMAFKTKTSLSVSSIGYVVFHHCLCTNFHIISFETKIHCTGDTD